jgi:regulatory protein
MKITAVTSQVRDKNRLNIFVDGAYRFSLLVAQYADLGVRVGSDISDKEIASLEDESVFGKVYTRALEYALTRPRSTKEMHDYLQRKTRDTKTKTGSVKKGISPHVAARVLERLVERNYVNDETFTRWWIENRHVRKGASMRKLQAELRAKGIEASVIERFLQGSERTDEEEIQKIIAKKRARYDDQKLMQYLARQGFRYDDIRQALETQPED